MAVIALFWTFLAAFSTASRVLDPRGPGFHLVPPSAPIVLTLFECGLWALLTPAVFRLAERFNPGRSSWAWRVPLLLGIGFVLAASVNAAIDFVRFDILDAPPQPGAEKSIWFGLHRLWFVRDYIIFLGVLAAGFAREYFGRYEARDQEAIRLQAETALLRSQLAEAQLATLRMQLSPHFLFNTLHTISALVDRDPAGVRRMIARLSELLRSTLTDGSTPERTVDEEVSFAARYLEIMQVRFEGRLEVAMDVDPDARLALVPTLILQPLVENAVKHGVARVRGVGRVAVHARRQGDSMLLTVHDSVSGPAVDAPAPAPGGVGLRNTAERLRQMYGTRARLSLQSAEAGGMIAEVELPYRVREEPKLAMAEVSRA